MNRIREPGRRTIIPIKKRSTFSRAATIPLLNYHPVFSHEEELHFIWCLAGARYWIGDKHQEFLDASVDRLTTGDTDS